MSRPNDFRALLFDAQERLEANWLKIWAILNGRRVDLVFYFGSTVHWITPAKRLWCNYETTMNMAFVDHTQRGYEIYLPVTITKYTLAVVGWEVTVKLHDVLTQDQYIAWVEKINKFPYV
jgi:hypothetical protein